MRELGLAVNKNFRPVGRRTSLGQTFSPSPFIRNNKKTETMHVTNGPMLVSIKTAYKMIVHFQGKYANIY